MKEQYQFHRNLVMRSPQLPLESRLDEATLYALLQDRLFMEAVYLASPVLYEECRRIRQGEQPDARGLKKVLRSLAKYYTRMYSRCTPFGLFSGCGVAEWASGPTTLVLDPNLFYRHTRFDMHYVCALAQFLTGVEEIARQLGFKRNNSLYFLGNEARYIEYYYNQGKRTHKISSIQRNEYFDRVLQAATGYHRMKTYADLLVDDSITKEEALGFIRELIHAQVLVSELEPSITGPEFIHQIKQTLQNLQADEGGIISSALSFLTKASEALHQLDHNRINDPASYDSIQALLRTLPVDFDAAKLFQCDLSLQLIEKKVADQYQLQLLEALELLHRLNPVQAQDMADFIREFKDRYEDRELPLLEVLDTETGIVYKENSGVELSPLLNDFIFLKPDQPRLVHWGKLENFWHKKLEEASAVKAFQIELQADDLSDFPTNRAVFPPSLSVLFRIVDAEKGQLFLESAAGSSAANLLGRFAHANPAINELVHSITDEEQALEKEVLYAEILHLPESRIGNILLHPSFRAYEIPYLSGASVENQFQLPLQDLLVSVRNNRVLLRSRRLNREIVPRLSSAHNYNLQPLPVYQFLCDLQTQGIVNGFAFGWGDIGWQYKFLPRVLYRQTILHAATWQFTKADWEELLEAEATEDAWILQLDVFRQRWQLPDQVVIADGDNELLIDFSNTMLRAVFYELLKSRQQLTIKEYLFRAPTGVQDLSGNKYANQLIAILQKKEATYTTVLPAIDSVPQQEQFSIGSEWLYYKIYCGSQSAENILVQVIYPFVQELKNAGKIRNWFFIRYTDPAFHIRFRVQLTAVDYLGEVLQGFSTRCLPFLTGGFIWKLQLDTYKRELQRYGSRSIEAVEELFCINSELTLQWLSQELGDEREEERWIWGLQSIDWLLEKFGYDLERKTNLLERLKTNFADEFSTGKLLKEQLDVRYRKHRRQLEEKMEQGFALQVHDSAAEKSILFILGLSQENQLEPGLDSLLASLIHMQLNRLFTSKPRQHEMVCYDFLHRYYFAKKMKKMHQK